MSKNNLEIQTFTLGQWQTNCFVLSVGKSCWIVDAGFDPEPMLDAIDGQGLSVEQVVLTHAHLDHIAGLHTVRHRYPDVPILVHADEEDFLTDTRLNLSAAIIDPVVAPEATGLLHHGEQLELNGVAFEIRHTPGHSPGGITLYQPESKLAIVGDTLFAGSIGRFDFPTSDGPRLMQSINEQLMTLPDDTRVMPGHGPETSVGHERVTNPYLNQPTGRPDGLVG
jgi:glyoxylase-like metal-dependent hydrolase (beta-lactamase superfamily II)